MATLTWLGEQDYGEGETPLSSCEWNGVLFTAGDKVVVTDPWMIAKARGNRFFRVEDEAEPVPQVYGPPRPPNYISAPYPEMWTNDPPDEPDQPVKRRGGGNRPPRIRENDD